MNAHRYMGNLGKRKSKTHFSLTGTGTTMFGVAVCGVICTPRSEGSLTGRALYVTCKRCVDAMPVDARREWKAAYVKKGETK